jgi:hypothetical protein
MNGQNILTNPLRPWKMEAVRNSKIEWAAYYDKVNNSSNSGWNRKV